MEAGGWVSQIYQGFDEEHIQYVHFWFSGRLSSKPRPLIGKRVSMEWTNCKIFVALNLNFVQGHLRCAVWSYNISRVNWIQTQRNCCVWAQGWKMFWHTTAMHLRLFELCMGFPQQFSMSIFQSFKKAKSNKYIFFLTLGVGSSSAKYWQQKYCKTIWFKCDSSTRPFPFV